MARILTLVHRTPYPPNKGDKIRSWHFLKHLADHHDVYLGFYEDSVDDSMHRPFLNDLSAEMCVVHVSLLSQKILSLRGLITGEAQSVAAYPKQRMREFVNKLIMEDKIDAIFLYSGITASLLPATTGLPVILDMVDVDSAKWQAYAQDANWPLSLIYGREAHKLAAFEAAAAKKSSVTLFVSDEEAGLFRQQTGLPADRVIGISNGVDLGVFTCRSVRRYLAPTDPVVLFTGAMTYPPNIDAVTFFAEKVLPSLRKKHPNLSFVIAGSPVAPSVQRLSQLEGVRVTGFVDDMRDELEAATIAVAPLFTARGIQNKVLEAMAMGLPTVASTGAAEGIWPHPEDTAAAPLIVADDADTIIASILSLLADDQAREKLGRDARAFVERRFSWASSFTKLDAVLKELGIGSKQ